MTTESFAENAHVDALLITGTKMINVVENSNGRWVIIHAGREVAKDFSTEADAWSWVDANVDDQVFCTPNRLAAPLEYRSPKPDFRTQ